MKQATGTGNCRHHSSRHVYSRPPSYEADRANLVFPRSRDPAVCPPPTWTPTHDELIVLADHYAWCVLEMDLLDWRSQASTINEEQVAIAASRRLQELLAVLGEVIAEQVASEAEQRMQEFIGRDAWQKFSVWRAMERPRGCE